MSKQLHQRKRSESSLNDNYWTPDDVYELLCEQNDIEPLLDVACTEENKKCTKGLSDSLGRDWVINHLHPTIVDVWCNPPNSKLGEFIRKAFEQYDKWGMKIMMIVPANAVSSKAWWESIEDPKDAGEDIFYKPIKGRIKFLENGKKTKYSARNAYMVVIWGTKH